MALELIWLGHGGWWLKTAQHEVVLDPFLSASPVAPFPPEELSADFILVSHGHFDHVADVASIAKRCQSTVVGCFEVAEWFRTQHAIEKTIGMNIGGGITLPFGHIKMTPAWHSSQLPDGSYGGQAAGYLVTIDSTRIYFACDTSLFGEMEWIGRAGIDVAVLPIGDQFTMGPDDSLEAIRRIRPKRALPAHYNTWPPIAQDAQAWADRVRAETEAEPIVLQPGGSVKL